MLREYMDKCQSTTGPESMQLNKKNHGLIRIHIRLYVQ